MIDVSDLIGIPYREGGRSLSGLDCMGLAIEVSKRLGRKLRDFSEDGGLNITRTENIKEGSILEFHKNGCLHVGVALSGDVFIHALSFRGVVIDPIRLYDVDAVYEIV